ncbi:MAG: hypothetical protein Q9186_001976 [Xanthomendoza sp. 1 TL-2023]
MAISTHPTGAARPTIASASRNAQGSGLPKAPVTTPKARPLISSAASPTKQRPGTPGVIGSDAENKRLSSTERSRSTSPVKSGLKPSLTRSTARPSTTASKKTPSQSISAIKAGNVKTPPVRTSTRNGRSASSPTITATKPALTGSVRDRSTVVVALPAVASGTPEKIRPSLGTHKSTTTEQRLRDVSLVNDMLRVARGEDGTAVDELKEDHGKQIGKTLTESRVEKDKARDIEDLMSSDLHSAIEVSTGEHVDTSVDGEDMEPMEQATSAEFTSQSPESTIKTRLKETAECLTKRLQDLQVSHEDKNIELRQLSEAKDAMETKFLELQSSNEREMHLCQENIEELRVNLKQVIQAKEDATRSNQQAVESLKGDVKDLEAWQAVLQSRLQQSNESTGRATKRVESLEAEFKHAEAWEGVLQARLQQSNESMGRDTNRQSEATQTFERQIQEHEVAKTKTAEEHRQEVSALGQELRAELRSKQSESCNQEMARAELQDTIISLKETNEREIHAIKCSLAAEHEDVVSQLRLKLDEALAKGHEGADHPDTLVTLKSQLGQLRATLGSVHASNTELRQALDDAEQQHKKEVSELNRALEDSQAKATCVQAEVIAQGVEKLTSLEKAKKTTDTALDRELENVADLRGRFEQSQDESETLCARTGQVEEQRVSVDFHLSNIYQRVQQLVADYQSGLDEKNETLDQLQTQMKALRTESESPGRLNCDSVLTSTYILPKLGDLSTVHRGTQSVVDKQMLRIQKPESLPTREKHDPLESRTGSPSCRSSCTESGPMLYSAFHRAAMTDSGISGISRESDEFLVDKKSGSDIQGQMVDMQEQLRQIGDMNDDILRKDQRLCLRLDATQEAERSPSPRALAFRHVKAPSDVSSDRDPVHITGYEGDESSCSP